MPVIRLGSSVLTTAPQGAWMFGLLLLLNLLSPRGSSCPLTSPQFIITAVEVDHFLKSESVHKDGDVHGCPSATDQVLFTSVESKYWLFVVHRYLTECKNETAGQLEHCCTTSLRNSQLWAGKRCWLIFCSPCSDSAVSCKANHRFMLTLMHCCFYSNGLHKLELTYF